MRRRVQRAYTLVEMLITMVTVAMVGGATLATYIYGLKMVQFTKPKLNASEEAKQTVSLITEEIRSARRLEIGSGTFSSFSAVGAFQPQKGSALRLYPTTNYNQFVQYYRDASQKRLLRMTSGGGTPRIVANCVSNEFVFQCENHLGQVLTNNFNNRVISVDLRFYQLPSGDTPIGTGGYYDFYQLRAKVTRRTLF